MEVNTKRLTYLYLSSCPSSPKMQVSGCLQEVRRRKDGCFFRPQAARLETAKIGNKCHQVLIQVLNHNANCLHGVRDGPMMKA
jgi:hypothetical protein